MGLGQLGIRITFPPLPKHHTRKIPRICPHTRFFNPSYWPLGSKPSKDPYLRGNLSKVTWEFEPKTTSLQIKAFLTKLNIIGRSSKFQKTHFMRTQLFFLPTQWINENIHGNFLYEIGFLWNFVANGSSMKDKNWVWGRIQRNFHI